MTEIAEPIHAPLAGNVRSLLPHYRAWKRRHPDERVRCPAHRIEPERADCDRYCFRCGRRGPYRNRRIDKVSRPLCIPCVVEHDRRKQ